MQGKVAANKDFLMKSSTIKSNFNVSKQRNVQTVLGNYYPLAREVCEAGSTLPCGKKYGNVLINIIYNCRAFDDNTVLFFAIPYTKLFQQTLYLRCERVVKRSSGMSEKMGDGICAKYGSKVAKY